MVATAAERERLVARLGIVSIEQLAAELRLERRIDSGVIRLSGRFEADVVQTCTVTLKHFPSHVEDSFETDFTTDPAVVGAEIVLALDDGPPEPIVDGAIDLGELVTQYLSLTLDPYPRAPGVSFAPLSIAADEAMSPLEVLKNMKTQG